MDKARRSIVLLIFGIAACGSADRLQTSLGVVSSPEPTPLSGTPSPTKSPPALAALPEGRIVFGRFADQGEQELLHVLGSDGQGERMIGKPDDCGTCASVSSDGQLLATLMAAADGRFDFYVMNSDGTGRREFPLPTGMQFGPGPFSGPLLYLGSFGDQESSANGIYRVEATDFSGLTQVTHTPKGEALENPLVVSPDGSHLLVFRPITENGEHGNLFLMDAQGKAMRRLNPEGTRVAFLPSVGVPGSFSPDSKRVAFGAYQGDQGQNVDPDLSSVYIVDVAGGSAQPISNPGKGSTAARFAPTGEVIAFQRQESGVYHLYLIAPDGTGEREIMGAGSQASSAWVPVWSPSGEWLAFERGTRFKSDLWLVRPDGSDLGQLTNHPAGYGGITWAP